MVSDKTYVAVVDALDRVQSELRARLAEKDQLIAMIREQLDSALAKIDRMEMVLVPGLGASRAVPVKPPEMIETPTSDWQTYLRNYMKEQDELEKKVKEQANGVSIEGRQEVHEQTSGPVA